MILDSLLKTNNLSLCLNSEYLNSVLQEIFKNNHRKRHTFLLLLMQIFIKIEQELMSGKFLRQDNFLKNCDFK
jgi:hypothetical protein